MVILRRWEGNTEVAVLSSAKGALNRRRDCIRSWIVSLMDLYSFFARRLWREQVGNPLKIESDDMVAHINVASTVDVIKTNYDKEQCFFFIDQRRR